jgi:hypothetical protein
VTEPFDETEQLRRALAATDEVIRFRGELIDLLTEAMCRWWDPDLGDVGVGRVLEGSAWVGKDVDRDDLHAALKAWSAPRAARKP